MVLSSYDNRCGVTGLAEPALLIASHIVPWAENKQSRLDPRNGISLNALHDKAFDRGLISFQSDLRMLCSTKLSIPDGMKKYFNHDIVLRPNKFPPRASFLEYHRDVCFVADHGV
jgi:predicted restriction endonuclease